MKLVRLFAAGFLLILGWWSTLPVQAGPRVQQIKCPDKSVRPQLDCSSDIGLKRKVKSANVKLAQFQLGLGGRYEEEASGEINNSTYQYAQVLENLCKNYNSCLMPVAEYQAESSGLRKKILSHLSLMDRHEEGAGLGAELWANAVDAQLGQQVQLSYRIEASRPGVFSGRAHISGAPLTYKDQIHFYFTPRSPTYIYILHLSSQGEASALFPDRENGWNNPMPGGLEVRFPPGSVYFEVDDAPGIETLHLIASHRPLTDLDARLEDLKLGKGAGGSAVLTTIGGHLCGEGEHTRGLKLKKSSVQCGDWTTRGLQLKSGSTGGSLVAAPGDDIVVVQHQIVHQ